MAEAWDIVPGQANDDELHFLLRVPVFNAVSAIRTPVKGTTYAAIDLPQKPMAHEQLGGEAISTFKLAAILKDEPGFLVFRFANEPTHAQTEPFEEYSDTRPFTWPMVIRAQPKFLIDEGNPRIVSIPSATPGGAARDAYLPRGYVDYEYKPETSRFTKVTVRKYASLTPWTRYQLKNTQPLAMPVEWDWYGFRESYVCLHPRIVVPAQLRGGIEGDRDPVPPNLRDGVRFEPTNHEDWSKWEMNEVSEKQEDGKYVRTQVIYHPPEQEWLKRG